MRLASYNIRKAVGLDWCRDPERILAVLDEIDADIVVLQEADKRFGSRAGVLPLRALDEIGYKTADVAVRAESQGWHGNVILHRRDYPITSSGRVKLPHLEPRGAIRARFETPKLEVVGAHLALTGGMRRRQLAVLGDHAARCEVPLILAGDFNEWGQGYVPAGGRQIVPGHSFHASRPFVSFDRFVIFGPVNVQYAHVHRSKLAAKASDHLPIVLDFEP